jgi:phosphatidylcholine synthase
MTAPGDDRGAPGKRARAYAVHAYTASGVALAFWAAAETCRPHPDPRLVLALFAAAVVIDASDGPLARAWEVKRWAPGIDGRTIDDIVDYLTYTFLPLLLVWRMGWLPAPAGVWVVPALVASLFGFANTAAKDEGGGFFLGFPSYWNVVAFYAGIVHHLFGPWPNAVMVLALAALTVVPVRFLYPNLAPPPWKRPLIAGAVVWTVVIAAMLWLGYPDVPVWMTLVSLAYPAFYTVLSAVLARRGGGGTRRGASHTTS